MRVRSGPKLQVITGDTVHDPRKPEDLLAFLFTRERQLQQELADVRRQLDAQRIRYSDQHKLQIRVSLDNLRRLFG